jgi:hypothetical protein
MFRIAFLMPLLPATKLKKGWILGPDGHELGRGRTLSVSVFLATLSRQFMMTVGVQEEYLDLTCTPMAISS